MLRETEYNGIKYYYRPETYDWNVIQESCGGSYTKFFDVEPGELWFDIGANVGGFTCYAASKGAFVYAFEPVLANFDVLVDNVYLNELYNNTKLHYAGVTKDGRNITLKYDGQNYGNCSIYDRGYDKEEIAYSIPAKDLNNYADYCLKVDTEGCEAEILLELDFSKIKKLVFEWHDWLEPNPAVDWESVQGRMHRRFNCVAHDGIMHYGW